MNYFKDIFDRPVIKNGGMACYALRQSVKCVEFTYTPVDRKVPKKQRRVCWASKGIFGAETVTSCNSGDGAIATF
eukprot:4876850-Amphidinium_carterae.1